MAQPLKPLVFQVLLALVDGERHGWALVREVQQRGGFDADHARQLLPDAARHAGRRLDRRSAAARQAESERGGRARAAISASPPPAPRPRPPKRGASRRSSWSRAPSGCTVLWIFGTCAPRAPWRRSALLPKKCRSDRNHGGAGGASSGAGGASGAAGTTGNASGLKSGPSGQQRRSTPRHDGPKQHQFPRYGGRGWTFRERET